MNKNSKSLNICVQEIHKNNPNFKCSTLTSTDNLFEVIYKSKINILVVNAEINFNCNTSIYENTVVPITVVQDVFMEDNNDILEILNDFEHDVLKDKGPKV